MKEQEKLKPCPFCGGNDVEFERNMTTNPKFMLKEPYRIICFKCFARSGQYGHTDEAVQAWNERARLAKEEKQKLLKRVLGILKANEFKVERCGMSGYAYGLSAYKQIKALGAQDEFKENPDYGIDKDIT